MLIPRTSCFREHHRRRLITGHRLCYFWIIVAALHLTSQPSDAVEITSQPLSFKYAAVGGSVTLRCHFILAPDDSGHLDIEWNVKPLNIDEDETTVAYYAGNRAYEDYYPFSGRVNFVSPDPASGNASIVIKELKPTDSAIYQCQVRQRHRFSRVRINVTVKERPAKPECYVRSRTSEPCEVVLGCSTTGNSSTILYTWAKEDAENLLPVGAFVDSDGGDLFLNQDFPGTYVCTVHNFVGAETCVAKVELDSCDADADADSNPLSIVLCVAALVAFVITLTIAIVVARCRGRTARHFGNEILEDSSPPQVQLLKV